MTAPSPPPPPPSPPPTRRQRLSRLVRLLVPAGITAVLLLAVGSIGFVEYSARPSFCKSCHLMQPYYDSWATSSHRDVPCIKCHYAPGIRAEAMGKFQAANQVVKYITGAYGTKPWAEIEDAACLRSGCHSERKVEGIVMYKGVRFDHTAHLGELRRGKQLRCTSCHSQIVQGDHVAVTEATCILCHFKDRPPGAPIGGCTGCHPAPPRVVSAGGYVVDHAQYVQDRVSCLSCHSEVTVGTGDVDRARCFNCHNEPARLAAYGDTVLVHRVHIAEHNVECTQCHTPIAHRVVSLATTFELDCRSCHAQVHDAQRRLYAGTGGHGSPESPSRMFMARVSCTGCHGLPTTVRGHERVRLAGEASCMSCHGIRYANLLPTWQREMERKLSRVAPVVAGARAALGSASVRGRATADSLLRLAQDNVELVRVGKAAHNVAYADQLLRAAVELVRQAVRAGPLAYAVPEVNLGPPLGENACFGCHIGVERAKVTFQGMAFDHEPHVLRGGLGCADCHTPLERHGGTTLTSPAACSACHHNPVRPMNCSRCHATGAGAAVVPAATITTATGDFTHDVHLAANLACSTCHTPPAMSARGLACETCHDQHHQPDRSCSSCHRAGTGVLAKHTRAAHSGCASCHASIPTINRWTRQICTTCHVKQASGHYSTRSCETCHQIPAMRTE
ncbi:MAG TPA: cytochrome c3 family protein [Gemmatimonadales bacterium]